MTIEPTASESQRTALPKDPATSGLDSEATDVGSVFVSNYPPYSFWGPEGLPAAERALDTEPDPERSLGLYLHIPFCRKRCKFCYFRVYTDKNAEQIGRYVDVLGEEVERVSQRAAIRGRPLRFVYFGGGTPSYLAVKQLVPLVDRLKAAMPWEGAEEIAFECEPGTLTHSKLVAIREIGVTRLSLGIENFNDEILRENGRAHVGKEIVRVRPWIAELGFPQLNIDLIAGMVGETWDSWRETVERAIDYDPDSVTLYQMELPFNTVYSKGKLRGEETAEFASWSLKREWHDYAFERFAEAGFDISSAYTVLRGDRNCKFVYRDAVWSGSDMIGCGVSAFSHMGGVHFQNHDRWEEYLRAIEGGGTATARAFETTPEELFTRELILQLKTGHVSIPSLEQKHGLSVSEAHGDAIRSLVEDGLGTADDQEIRLTRGALLRVDQLLPRFYDERYRDARYT